MRYLALALMSALVMETTLSLWGIPGLLVGLVLSSGFAGLLWMSR